MRTITKYEINTSQEEQSFAIPGWGGVAAVIGSPQFVDKIDVYCHTNDDEPKYSARFRVTATGQEAPKPRSDFIYIGSAVCGASGIPTAGSYVPQTRVWHVWRNAVGEKLP